MVDALEEQMPFGSEAWLNQVLVEPESKRQSSGLTMALVF